MNGIPQSAVTFGAFVVMFLAFITAKGELPLYMGFLFGGGSSGQAPSSPVSANAASTAPTTTPGSIGLFGIGNMVSGASSLLSAFGSSANTGADILGSMVPGM